MINKNDRTMEVYRKAGAEMRLLKHLGTKTAVDVSKVLSAKDTDRLMRALNTIETVCSRAEDNMFRDYPELGNAYTDVFYGSVDMEPRNDVDREIIDLARTAANELFG